MRDSRNQERPLNYLERLQQEHSQAMRSVDSVKRKILEHINTRFREPPLILNLVLVIENIKDVKFEMATNLYKAKVECPLCKTVTTVPVTKEKKNVGSSNYFRHFNSDACQRKIAKAARQARK